MLESVNLYNIKNISSSYFHFTDKVNLYDNKDGLGIINGGLSSMPRNRLHMVGDDLKYPCIYFAQGYEGILELMDVWIRYEYSELARKENYSPGNIRVDFLGMKKTYQIFYEKLKESIYLKLELKSGNNPKTSDFNPLEEDLKKKKYFKNDDNLFVKWIYGVNTDYSSFKMERWNMTTHLGLDKVILPDKIKIVQNSEGKTDALSVLLDIYDSYRDRVEEVYDLDRFIWFVKKRKEINYE